MTTRRTFLKNCATLSATFALPFATQVHAQKPLQLIASQTNK